MFSELLLFIIIYFITRSTAFELPQSSSRGSIEEVNRRRELCLKQLPLTCFLEPTANNQVTGLVSFSPIFRVYNVQDCRTRCLVRIRASVQNLTAGLHGFHIHTYGDIRSSDGASLGGHFTNPVGRMIPHGFPGSRRRHWGDFGNLEADQQREAIYNRIDRKITLPAIIGRGIVIHADADGGPEFQPSGSSGARQARCVIGIGNPLL